MKIRQCLLVIFFFAAALLPVRSHAQTGIVEAVKEATKKIIKAVDLKIQRLQNGVIDLQNLQRKIENKLSELRLDEISEWTRKQKEQYAAFFDELATIKKIITYAGKYKRIYVLQKGIYQQFLQSYSLLKNDSYFTPDALTIMYGVYTGMVDKSLAQTEDVVRIMTSFSTKMTDAERLKLISDVINSLENLSSDLKQYTREKQLESIGHARNKKDRNILRQIYGIQP